ncbi:alpha/beta hydrolase [Streptomyces cavernicola]|uniref:Alpha/beta hydrolase-fold protein n=1 Tax=Streptomyces cavernicola TaxID=3043613 RepID=A0ABT6SHA6_9ACTN|nr:alpha/beta hydrolase-fold protein [Streptomyces sp. B-S-A6]MDI3406793.1 alpha/beta hydrolase-fold protein [Streptomyces sp. B-S-A6]
MGLKSNLVLALAALLAVLLFAGTVWLWPKLARRGWRAVLGRVVLLAATQLTLFATVGLAANRSYEFYASWADLFGREQDMGVVEEHDTGGANRALRVLGTQPVNHVARGSKRTVGGRIQHVVITGERTGIRTPAYVYLPPEYFRKQDKGCRFPTAIVITGYPGTAENLLNGLRYPATAHDQARRGKMQPMILVMLRPTVAPPRDTECVDVPHGPQTETFFAKDLPAAIASHYRVGGEPGGWGVIGNSTGGYCALKLALKHPDRFAAGAGLSADYRAPIDAATGDLFQGDKRVERESDLMWLLDHRPPPKVSLLATSSRQGEGNYAETVRFLDKGRAPTRMFSIVLDSGGHNFNTWRREIPPALRWMSERLSVE